MKNLISGLLALLILPSVALADVREIKVSNVDGSGARIRRKIGTELIAAKGDVMRAADTINTDASTVVDLALADGSLVRVGPNTTYTVESIEPDASGAWSWAFQMNKGEIRAQVEKSPRKDAVKFRIKSPAGTMGVRGTEFVFIYSQEKQRAELYTLSGKVAFAAEEKDLLNALRSRMVEGGQTSAIHKGERLPASPRPFNAQELIRGIAVHTAATQNGKANFSADEMNRVAAARARLFGLPPSAVTFPPGTQLSGAEALKAMQAQGEELKRMVDQAVTKMGQERSKSGIPEKDRETVRKAEEVAQKNETQMAKTQGLAGKNGRAKDTAQATGGASTSERRVTTNAVTSTTNRATSGVAGAAGRVNTGLNTGTRLQVAGSERTAYDLAGLQQENTQFNNMVENLERPVAVPNSGGQSTDVGRSVQTAQRCTMVGEGAETCETYTIDDPAPGGGHGSAIQCRDGFVANSTGACVAQAFASGNCPEGSYMNSQGQCLSDPLAYATSDNDRGYGTCAVSRTPYGPICTWSNSPSRQCSDPNCLAEIERIKAGYSYDSRKYDDYRRSSGPLNLDKGLDPTQFIHRQ